MEQACIHHNGEELAQEYDTTAEVVEVETDFAGISSQIGDGLLWFDKEKFFVFGLRFDGELDKVLEKGMQVKVRYKFAQSHFLPVVLAVWLGDEEPECTLRLKPIYGQSGRVIRKLDDNRYLLLTSSNSTDQSELIIIEKSSTFRDGYRVKTKDPVLCGNERLVFDASPLSCEHPSGAKYEATCAWVGQEPRIVDRFVQPGDPECCVFEEPTTKKIANGKVIYVLNESVALVDIEYQSGVRSAFLFRSSFNQTGCNKPLHELARVGDRLLVQLKPGFIFSERKVWFVEKVLEHVENKASRDFSVRKRINNQSVEFAEPRLVNSFLTDESEIQNTMPENLEVSSDILQGDEELEYEPFTKEEIDFKHYFGLKAKLVLKKDGGACDIGIEHSTHFTSVLGRVIFGLNKNKPINSKVMNSFVGRNVHLNAEISNERITVGRIWSGNTGCPSVECYLKDQLACERRKSFLTETPCKGKIVSIPLHASAIAMVADVRVLIPISSIITDTSPTRGIPCIKKYLCVGTKVCLLIMERKNGGDLWYESVKTWRLKKRTEKQPKTTMPHTVCSRRMPQTLKVSSDIHQGEEELKYVPFAKKKIDFKHYFGLKAKLVLKKVGSVCDVGIEHSTHFSSVLGRVIFGLNKNKPIDSKVMNSFVGRIVHLNVEISNEGIFVGRIWSGNTGCPSVERYLKDQLVCERGKSFPTKTPCKGKIVSIPLHASAIATVADVRVLISVSSIVTDARKTITEIPSIRKYLSIGSEVCAIITEQRDGEEILYKSLKTWSLKK